jgi:3'-5' exoribonuclease
MSAARPPVSKLAELTPGQQGDFFALLADRTRGLTREGKPYYHCRFRDARRTVSFMAWADDRWFEPCENDWREGQFYKLRAVYQEHERYGPQIELRNIRPVDETDPADGFDPSAFVETSPHDPEKLLAELRELAVGHIADEPLRGLVLRLLDEHGEALRRLPATRDRAYPYRGGWLEHACRVTRIAIDLAGRYASAWPDLRPPLNRDLVTAAAILHDIGRVLEWGDETPMPAVTVPGRLVGHLVLGRDLVRDAARTQPGLDPELAALLEHILLVPPAAVEGVGPRWPLVMEGVIVHAADDLDLKMGMFARRLLHDPSPGPFTERDPALGRKLYKGRGDVRS